MFFLADLYCHFGEFESFLECSGLLGDGRNELLQVAQIGRRVFHFEQRNMRCDLIKYRILKGKSIGHQIQKRIVEVFKRIAEIDRLNQKYRFLVF